MVIQEQRHYPRVVLDIEDGYFGQFILPNHTPLMASILNLSAGGVNFSIPLNKQELIREGDILLLKNISGTARLAFFEDVKTEIRWIKVLDGSKSASVGCHFLDVSEPVRDQMMRFVDSERVARGQYR